MNHIILSDKLVVGQSSTLLQDDFKSEEDQSRLRLIQSADFEHISGSAVCCLDGRTRSNSQEWHWIERFETILSLQPVELTCNGAGC